MKAVWRIIGVVVTILAIAAEVWLVGYVTNPLTHQGNMIAFYVLDGSTVQISDPVEMKVWSSDIFSVEQQTVGGLVISPSEKEGDQYVSTANLPAGKFLVKKSGDTVLKMQLKATAQVNSTVTGRMEISYSNRILYSFMVSCVVAFFWFLCIFAIGKASCKAGKTKKTS